MTQSNTGWRLVLWAALLVATLYFLYMVRGVLLPFVLAFVIATLLDPLIHWLRLRGWPRWAAVSSVLMAFLVVAGALGFWIGPVAGRQMSTLRDKVTGLAGTVFEEDRQSNFFVRWSPDVEAERAVNESDVDRLLDRYKDQMQSLGLPSTRHEIYEQVLQPHRDDLAKMVTRFFGGFVDTAGAVLSQLFVFAFTPLIAFYMLLEIDQFKRRSISWIPPSIRAGVIGLLEDIGTVFVRYVRGVMTGVLGYMAVMSIVLSLMGAPYSILLGILFGAVYLLPVINVFISVPLLFVATGLSGRTGNLILHVGSPWAFATIVCLVYLISHVLYDSIIFPRLVGKSIGLHPIVSIFVVLAGGALFGIVGMLVAFPLAGAVKVILDRLLKITTKGPDAAALPVKPLRHRRTG